MELAPKAFELRGSPELFETWARVTDHTIDDLGEDEFDVLVGKVDTARAFSPRLRREPKPAGDYASWHSLDADASEVDVVLGCFLNLAYGPAMGMPEGLSRIEIADMFEDLARQLNR